MKYFNFIAVVLIILFVLSACGEGGGSINEQSLVGRWQISNFGPMFAQPGSESHFEFTSDEITLQFFEDGRVHLSGTGIVVNPNINEQYVWAPNTSGIWSAGDGRLIIDGEVHPFSGHWGFSISGNTLNLDNDRNPSLSLTRIQ